MMERWRKLYYRRTLLGAWALLTLVLFFAVILMFGEMARHGINPLELPTLASGAEAPRRVEGPTEAREITLYFANADGRLLETELRRFEHSESTVENCRQLLKALIQGPQSGLQPIIPGDATVRGVYMLEGGELVVDLSREVEQGIPKSASAEGLLVYAIVNTLTQPAVTGTTSGARPVNRVRFLFEGSPAHERFPRHIDVSEPIARDESWVLSAAPAPVPNG